MEKDTTQTTIGGRAEIDGNTGHDSAGTESVKSSAPAAMVFSADDLIQTFGDQAYHKGVRMALEALCHGDPVACRALSQANIELIKRGYHKHPRLPK